MKLFQLHEVIDVAREDPEYVQHLEERLVLEAYRAGYCLPEKPLLVRSTHSPFAALDDGMVTLRWRGYGIKMAEAEG